VSGSARASRAAEVVACEVGNDGVAILRMADVAGKNALSESMVRALTEHLARLGADARVKVVVLGGLPHIFCSGASREILIGLATGDVAPSDLILPRHILDLPVPCIAAMEGHAIGGGFALGLCADVLVLARDSRYSANFMNFGFTPGMGMTTLLEEVLSPPLAHEMLYTGEARRGLDFQGRSGFNYVLPRAEVMPRALTVAARIAEKPREALIALKRTLSAAKRRAFEGARTTEALMHEVSFKQPDILRRIREETE
jgi:polyketide biosynthesis enoyl-CoA hydratase PksI